MSDVDRGKTIVEFANISDSVEISNLSQHYIEHGLRWQP
jgi:hypothetical protein